MTLQKWKIYGDNKNITGLQGVGEGIFQDNETIIQYNTVMLDTCHYMLVKNHRLYITNIEP